MIELGSLKTFRLSTNEPQKVKEALQGLYDIDIEAFKEDDQYGLNLLQLALIQPSAFWIAFVNDIPIGYLSIFSMQAPKLYSRLISDSKKGILDLPDLISDYSKELSMSYGNNKITNVHLYIDALAVVKGKGGIVGQDVSIIRSSLIDAAKRDLCFVNKATISTISVKRAISKIINDLNLPLKHVGGRTENASGDKKYRELFVASNVDQSMLDKILNALSSFKSNFRSGIEFSYNVFSGTAAAKVFIEPKD